MEHSSQSGLTAGAQSGAHDVELNLRDLRLANLARVGQFRNAVGDYAHSTPDGSDWTPADWMTALAGEVGELANLLKKVRRGDLFISSARQDIADEIADVAIYLDLLAYHCGVDLGAAVVSKFNRTSERVRAPVYLWPDGTGWSDVPPETS